MHIQDRKRNEHLAEDEKRCAEEINTLELIQENLIYYESSYYDLASHLINQNSDLLAMSRECERDSNDQINQHVLSMVLAATLILACLISLIIQGSLSDNCNDGLKIAYSFFSSSSLALLIFCIIIYFVVAKYSSSFMYEKNRDSFKLIMELIEDLKQNSNSQSSPKHCMMIEKYLKIDIIEIKNMQIRRKEFVKKQQRVKEYLLKLHQFDQEGYGNMNNNTFDSFWELHLKSVTDLATILFYIGTIFFIIATVIYMHSYYGMQYNSWSYL